MSGAGVFISFEGGDGSGKTTQLRAVAARLGASGREVVVTKEPGGTPLADRIRALLLDPQWKSMDALTELFLLAASRRQHVVEVLEPALERGAVVLCDRFTDATLAYQGFGRLLNLDQLRRLNQLATNGLQPRLTLLFDLPEATGVERARARNSSDVALESESRIDGEELQFHRRVREGYLALALAEPRRFVTIDASGTVEEVGARVTEALKQRLGDELEPER